MDKITACMEASFLKSSLRGKIGRFYREIKSYDTNSVELLLYLFPHISKDYQEIKNEISRLIGLETIAYGKPDKGLVKGYQEWKDMAKR
jgi:hypothetical protein